MSEDLLFDAALGFGVKVLDDEQALADFVKRSYGLPSVLYVALTGVVLGIFVCLFLRETAPRKLAMQPARAG